MKDIYSLELLEMTRFDTDTDCYTTITRVPGGWIFTENYDSFFDGSKNTNTNMSSVFVPYNDEFKPKEEPKMSDPSLI